MRTYNGKVETSLWHCSIGICEGCHYYGYDRGEACMKQLIKEAYQAHLSDERALENQLRKIKEIKAEIERLKIRNKTLSAITRNYDWKFAKVKSEAIKEFAERVKNECESGWLEIRESDFDNLVKEMAGDNNEEA